MTCPDRPDALDLLLAGEPPAPEASGEARAHAAACDACAAELALARRIDAALAARREVSAPPALVAAALAGARAEPVAAASVATRAPINGTAVNGAASGAARRAPRRQRPAASRGAVPGAHRARRLAMAAAAIALLALAWAGLRTGAPALPAGPALASGETAEPTPLPTPAASGDATPEADAPPSPTTSPLPLGEGQGEGHADRSAAPEAPTAAPLAAPSRRTAPRRAAARRAPRRATAVPEAPALAQNNRPGAPEATDLQASGAEGTDTAPPATVAEPEPTPAQVERAEAELKLALGLIAGAQRQAGRVVREEADALSTTLNQTLPF